MFLTLSNTNSADSEIISFTSHDNGNRYFKVINLIHLLHTLRRNCSKFSSRGNNDKYFCNRRW